MNTPSATPKTYPAFCIAAAQSGSGKTTLTLALLRALKRRGLKVQPFKCGPDYIDPTFHKQAAGTNSINLDTWMMKPEGVLESWEFHTKAAEVSVVEGVMGLFDGRVPGELEGSTADCARLLKVPVILVVDAKGMAGSIAPLVSGYWKFHPEVRIVGVIANRVGSPRHADILRIALKKAHLPPLLGALPKSDDWVLPERHLGLVPFLENEKSDQWFETLADSAEEHIAIDKLLKICTSYPMSDDGISVSFFNHKMSEQIPMKEETSTLSHTEGAFLPEKKGKTIAVAMDKAFHFYYQDNFRFLKDQGHTLVEFSPIHDTALPNDIDILYLGGGYPEIFAQELSQNIAMRNSISSFAEHGGTIYAECGGYMYLSKELDDGNGNHYPMCGIIDATASMGKRLRSLGYREVNSFVDLPWKPEAVFLRGHEFHYSDMAFHTHYSPLFRMDDGKNNIRDVGVQHKNIYASYVHLHFSSFGWQLV